MKTLSPFENQPFLNLETFRKSGVGVKTPVWFVQDADKFYVHTQANSAKVKRIRNNSKVNIAPCKADGTLLGEWVPALAREITDQETISMIDRLFGKKYGFRRTMFAMISALTRRKNTKLEIKVMK